MTKDTTRPQTLSILAISLEEAVRLQEGITQDGDYLCWISRSDQAVSGLGQLYRVSYRLRGVSRRSALN